MGADAALAAGTAVYVRNALIYFCMENSVGCGQNTHWQAPPCASNGFEVYVYIPLIGRALIFL